MDCAQCRARASQRLHGRRRHLQCADTVALHGQSSYCCHRGKDSASPLDLKALDCARRCQMSFAMLMLLTCAESHNLTFIRRAFRELHTLILERHAATAWLAICCQALGPHGQGTRTNFPSADGHCTKVDRRAYVKIKARGPPEARQTGARYILRVADKPEVLVIYPPTQKTLLYKIGAGQKHFQNCTAVQ